jgi:hypothetical protein
MLSERLNSLLLSITNKMQHYTVHLFLQYALHVSGGSSAHHQELKTVHTAILIYYIYIIHQFRQTQL